MLADTKCRILILIDGLGIGGAEKSLLEIVTRFCHIQVTLCYLYPIDDLRPAFEAQQIPVIWLGVKGKYPSLDTVNRLSHIIRDNQIELIHVLGFYAAILGRWTSWREGTPLVDSFTNEQYTAISYAELPLISRWKLRFIEFLDRSTSHQITHVISNSSTIKVANARKMRIPLDRVSVVYRGRTPEKYLLTTEGTVVKTDKYDLSRQSSITHPLILNVARLIPRKGQMELIDAIALLQQRGYSTHLWIAGEGHFRDHLEEKIEAMHLQDSVYLLGNVDDIPMRLQAATVFVFTSHFEGLPGAMIEAMFAARPIVAVDTPVHREMITHGETGLLVALQDAHAIAEGIQWMLEHPAEANAMGQRAQQVALERFHIDKTAEQYEQVLLDIASTGRVHA